MKVVLDTNVLVSALIGPSSFPALVIAAWYARRFGLVCSEQLLAEFENVVARPGTRRFFRQSPEWLATLLGRLRHIAALVEPVHVTVVVADPDDDIVLGTAIAGNADYIVTGDKHLLVLGSFEGIPIVSPWQFLQILEADKPDSSE